MLFLTLYLSLSNLQAATTGGILRTRQHRHHPPSTSRYAVSVFLLTSSVSTPLPPSAPATPRYSVLSCFVSSCSSHQHRHHHTSTPSSARSVLSCRVLSVSLTSAPPPLDTSVRPVLFCFVLSCPSHQYRHHSLTTPGMLCLVLLCFVHLIYVGTPLLPLDRADREK